MIRLQFGGTADAFEKLLASMLAEWDELERWVIRNDYNPERLEQIRKAKSTILQMIAEIRKEAHQ
jgi:hypothetical protein